MLRSCLSLPLTAFLCAVPVCTAAAEQIAPMRDGINTVTAAVMANDAVRLKELLDAGASPESRDGSDYTALMKAAACGHTECVKVLLKAGANPKAEDNDENYTAAYWAAKKAMKTACAFCWKRQVDGRSRCNWPRMFSCARTGPGGDPWSGDLLR